MPEFLLKCTSATTGKDYTITMRAPSAEAAEAAAIAEGHVVGGKAMQVTEHKPVRTRNTTRGCTLLGLLFFLLGLAGIALAMIQPTAVEGMHNIGLLHERALLAALGTGLLITGGVFLSASAIGAQLRSLHTAR